MNKKSDKKTVPVIVSQKQGPERSSRSTNVQQSRKEVKQSVDSDNTDSLGSNQKVSQKKAQQSLATNIKERRDEKADEKKSKSLQKTSSQNVDKSPVKQTTVQQSEKIQHEKVKQQQKSTKRLSSQISQGEEEVYQKSDLKRQALQSKEKYEAKPEITKSISKADHKVVQTKAKDKIKSLDNDFKQRVLEKERSLQQIGGVDQLTSLRCRACFQSSQAPYKTEDVEHNKLKTLYDFVVCKQCLIVAHIGCLDQEELTSLKASETLTLTKYDIDSASTNNQKVKVIQQCKSCPTSDTKTCIACYQTDSDFVLCELDVLGAAKEYNLGVHHICALSLPEVFQLDQYSSKPKFTVDLSQFPADENKGLLVPKELSRKNDNGEIEVFNTVCEVCQKDCGYLVPCGQNFDRVTFRLAEKPKEKITKFGCCKEVGHPLCLLIKDTDWKSNFMQETYKCDTSGFEGKVTPHKSKIRQIEDNMIVQTRLKFYCSEHPIIYVDKVPKKVGVTCYCCYGDPLDVEGVIDTWIECEGCMNWFHTQCAKYNQLLMSLSPYDRLVLTIREILDLLKVKPDLDLEAEFWCEMCEETKKMIKGEGGKILEKLYSNQLDQIDRKDFLAIDRRMLNRPVSREPILGQPTHLQVKLQTDLWYAVSKILETELTSQTLINLHYKELEFVRVNMKSTVTLFTKLKDDQAKESKKLFNEMLPGYELQKDVYDILNDGYNLNDSLVEKLKEQQEKVKPFVDKLESSQQGGHLTGITEQVYVQFKRRCVLLQAAELLKQDLIDENVVYQMLDYLRRIDCHKSNTFARFKEIKDQYEELLNKLPTVNYNQSDVMFINQPLKTLAKQNERPWDTFFKNLHHFKNSTQARQELINDLREKFKKISCTKEVLRVINNYKSDNNAPIVDLKKYIKLMEACEQSLTKLIEKPQIDYEKPKPVDQLLRNICYMAFQPIKVDVEKLIIKYEASASWESKVKKYVGDNKDHWIKMSMDRNLKSPQGPLPNELSQRPPDLVFDQNLDALARRKYLFVVERKKICGRLLSNSDVVEDQLKEFIEVAQNAFSQLQNEINLVQCKVDLLNRVLSIVGGDPNFEEQLPEVIHRVNEAKVAGICLPEDLLMMLEAKMEIINELRCEFNATLDRCADSFIKQSVSDLRKILQKATKEHQLQMEKEKKIVDSLAKSEEWFVSTFAKLKQMCGPQLHNIDFKDYFQLHSVIKTIKDCEMLLKLPATVKSENLVAAARNLYSSLQGAKWLFEVNALMSGGHMGQPTKELSYLLNLYYSAKELQINFGQISHPDEYILMDDEPSHKLDMISDFELIALNAVEFDSLFGTHLKIISTLERFESLGQIPQLVETVERIQRKMLQIKESSKCLVSPSAELEVLEKVRNYITLNQDYLNFIGDPEVSVRPIIDSESMEVDHETQVKTKKISFQKALKLQRQARESQIPDDIPVLKRLNQSIQNYEKFKKQCSEYLKFREKLKSKGQSYLAGLSSNITAEKAENTNDAKFTLSFVQKLIDDKESQEIETSSEILDSEKLKSDLQRYERWKAYAEAILKRLEKDLNNNGDMQLDSDITTQFLTIKDQVCESPVYNHELFIKMQAFDWIYSVNRLINKPQTKSQAQVRNLSFWKQMYEQHSNFLEVLPVLKDHTILQRILWEIELAKGVIEFVQINKNTQRSLAAKFVLSQKNEGNDNFMAFKSKQQREKFQRILETTMRLKVDISPEVNDLKNWINQHDQYTKMSIDGSLWEQGYEKLKMVQRNIFHSPIDNSHLYSEIEKRLLIADEIRTDLKAVMEQAVQCGRRIKFSRVEFDLSHFSENCQISLIPEVEKIQKQIQQSQEVLEKCEQMIENNSETLDQVREMYLTRIPIDLEVDEMPLKKEIFERTVLQLFNLPYSQFKLLEKDYLKLKHQMSRMGIDFSNERFDQLRVQVEKCLKQIKTGDLGNIHMDEVDFVLVIAEKKARIYQSQIKISRPVGTTQLAQDQVMKGSDDDESMISESSSSSSGSSSSMSNSLDDSSDLISVQEAEDEAMEGGEDEMSEEVLEEQQENQQPKQQSHSATNSLEQSSSNESESDEPVGIAQGRERRQVKPNMMDDHIYFVKKSAHTDTQYYVKKSTETESVPQLTKSQLIAKRQAKIAAKQFEKQKLKTNKEVHKPSTSLDFTALQPSEDSQLLDSISIMRQRIRNEFKAKITTCLEGHTCFGEKETPAFKQTITALTLELEDIVANKYPLVDNQYRSKIGDVCRNIDTLKQCNDIAELYLTKRTYSNNKLMQTSLTFKEQFEKAVQARNERRKQQRPVVVKRAYDEPSQYNPIQTSQFVGDFGVGQRPGFLPQIKTIQVEDYTYARRNSANSVESLESNPARFSDDEQPKTRGYDPSFQPHQINRIQQASFAYPPPGVPLLTFNYDPTMYLQTQLSQKNQVRDILYDPIAHGNQPFVPQKQRLTTARPGSLLKVYEGSLDVTAVQKDGQINVQLCSFQDAKVYQKLPMPAKVLTLKGQISLKQAQDHFIKVKSDPSSGMLLKGFTQRQSYLNGDTSDKYQRFFDIMEQTQSVAVYTLLEGVSVYLIPISKSTKDFVSQMGIQTDSSHLDLQSKKIDFEKETHMFAWISQVRQQLPVRSSNIWNPTVLKNLPVSEASKLQDAQQVNPVKYSSPITSEEPSFESQSMRTKKRVEINLIQPAFPVYANPIKAEQLAEPEEMDEKDIDALIARMRSHGQTDIEQVQKMLEPIILKYSSMGKRNEKIEAFLKELIAKKEMIDRVKQEPNSGPVMGSQPRPHGYQHPSQHNSEFQYQQQMYQQPPPYYRPMQQQMQHEMPPHMQQQQFYPRPQYMQPPQQQFASNQMRPPGMQGFPAIRPPAPPLPQQYQPMQPQQQMGMPGQINPQMQMYPGQQPMFTPPFPGQHFYPGPPPPQMNQNVPRPPPPNTR